MMTLAQKSAFARRLRAATPALVCSVMVLGGCAARDPHRVIERPSPEVLKALPKDPNITLEKVLKCPPVQKNAADARFAEREKQLDANLAAAEKLSNDDPSLQTSLDALSDFYDESGRYQEALAAQARLLELREKLYGKASPTLVPSLDKLASLTAKAAPSFNPYKRPPYEERALEIAKSDPKTPPVELARRASELASLAYTVNKHDEAQQYIDEAYEIIKKLVIETPQDPRVVKIEADLNDWVGRAEPYYLKALGLCERDENSDKHLMIEILHKLADRENNRKRLMAVLRRAIRLAESSFGPKSQEAAQAHVKLAQFYWQLSQYSDSASTWKRVLLIDENTLNSDNPRTAEALDNLGDCYSLQGKNDVGNDLNRRAMPIYEKTFGVNSRQYSACINDLINYYLAQKRYAEFAVLEPYALSLKPDIVALPKPTGRFTLR